MGHAVALVQNDPQELLLHGGGDVPGAVGEGLRIAADVGQGGAQLVGDVGHELPLHLLVLPLLGDVVENHQHAPLPLPVEGGQQQVQHLVPHPDLPLQVVGGGHGLLQGILVPKELLIGGVRADGTAQHALRRRIGVDHLAVPVKGHHAVGHVEEQGVQLVALVLHLAQGVPQLPGHVIEGVSEHADLVP